MQAFPAAFLLDPANAVDPNGTTVLPPWGSLHEEDKGAVKNLLRRMAPRGKQQAVVEELLQFTSAGYADRDFARAAMVCYFPSHCSMSQVHYLPGMTSFAQLNTPALMQSKGKNKKGQPIRKAAETRRAVWTSSMEKKYPLLCAIALRLLSMHATSCGSERNWSVWRFTCRDNRRRLALQKVCCLPCLARIAGTEHDETLCAMQV